MKPLLGFLGLFSLALALRLWGFAQGYPNFYEAAFGRFLYGQPPSTAAGAAHYHFVKNQAYFTRLIDPDNQATEEVARFESRSGVRGATIAIYRLP